MHPVAAVDPCRNDRGFLALTLVLFLSLAALFIVHREIRMLAVLRTTSREWDDGLQLLVSARTELRFVLASFESEEPPGWKWADGRLTASCRPLRSPVFRCRWRVIGAEGRPLTAWIHARPEFLIRGTEQ